MSSSVVVLLCSPGHVRRLYRISTAPQPANRFVIERNPHPLTPPQEAQISLGHEFTAPPPASTYLSVTDELLLLHFYISQASKICRGGFGLPEVVESTAISYLKRFYLKNSVMEWHPKVIM